MSSIPTPPHFNPNLDLIYSRKTSLNAEQIWRGWTDSHTLKDWFCPRPWFVKECRIELMPGGEFYTLMEGPEGQSMANHGTYLEVVKNEKLTWTNMMSKGYRPSPDRNMGFPFVATIYFQYKGGEANYLGHVRHADEQGKKEHEKMGFQEGWEMAFRQLEKLYL